MCLHPKLINFGECYNYNIACGGAVTVATKAILNGNVRLTGAFSVGEIGSVIWKYGCSWAVALAANSKVNGNIIHSGSFYDWCTWYIYGDVYAIGAVGVVNSKIIGNIMASMAFAKGAGSILQVM
jgi:hypothetical protein